MLARMVAEILSAWAPCEDTLRNAVEVARILSRAQGGAVFACDGRGLRTLARSLSEEQAARAAAACAAVSPSGPLAGRVGSRAPGAEPAPEPEANFLALPLCRDGALVGVLYLEGLAEACPRTVHRAEACARALALMLTYDAPTTPGVTSDGQ